MLEDHYTHMLLLVEYKGMFDKILFRFYYINNVHKRYQNFFNICLNILRKNYPFTAVTKDGTQIKIENLHDLVWLSNSDVWKYCKINGDIITVEKNGLSVKLYGWRY